jgi:hypothetical protein
MKTKVIYRKPLGNVKRKYRQDRFIISTFKAKTQNIRRGLELCKEAGFNLVEFGWVNPEDSYRCVTACEEVGIDGIFQNWDVFGGFQTTEGDATIDVEKLKEYIEYTKKYRHVAGYYVWDEPYVDEKIQAAAEQVRTMEEYDPNRLPFTVAIPSYNDKWTWENGMFEGYLRKYTEVIQPAVLSLDYYPFVYKQPDKPEQLDSSKLFLDIALLRELSLEKQIPMWFYFQAQDDVMKYGYEGFAPEKIRTQVYIALLYGAVGLQYYNVYNGTITEDAKKGPLFEFVKELNGQVNQLGKTLMALESVGVFHSPEVLAGNEPFDNYRQPITESKILAEDELPFRCSVGEFSDCEENQYLLIQNRDFLVSREFYLKLKKDFRIYTVSKEDGMQVVSTENTDKLSLNLEPGDAVLLRFQDATEEAYLIDYVLEK